jgi:hypothetical protein
MIDLRDNVDELFRCGHATKDATRLLCRFDASVVKRGICSGGTVLKEKTFETSVVGITHGRGNANIGGDSGEDEVLDASVAEDDVQVCRVERSLAWLVDDRLVFVWLELWNDIPSRFSANKDATSCNVGITDTSVHSRRTPTLVGRKIGKIATVTFSGVDDNVTLLAEDGQQMSNSWNNDAVSLYGFWIHASKVTFGRAEIDLHIDDDESGVVRSDFTVVWPWVRISLDEMRLSSSLEMSDVREDDGSETEWESERN